METSFLTSVFFILAVAIFVSGFWMFPKSGKKLLGVVWIPVTAVFLMCFHVLAGGIINLIRLPVNIVSVGFADIALGVFFWQNILRKKEKQIYEWKKEQFLFLGLLGAATAAFAIFRYGTGLELNYYTIDPAAHLRDAMDVVNKQQVQNMFYAALNNALLIELLAPLAVVSEYYKFFLLAEVLNLFLSGAMFYALIQRWCQNRFTKAAAFIAAFLYTAGYPLNNALFGFTYLGMGVTIIACLLLLTDSFIEEKLNPGINIFLMMAGCLGIFESYMLFMPVVYFAVFFCIAGKRYKQKRLFTVKTVTDYLAIFLLPCILGLYYGFFGVFSGDVTVGSAISAEGAIYRDLYSNFLALAPFAMIAVYQMVKKKIYQTLNIMLPMMMVFMAGMFAAGIKGKVSSYYYYKNYYVLWLLVFLMAFIGISYLSEYAREVVVCCFLSWGAVALFYVTRLEETLADRKPLFVPMQKADQLNDVYSFNCQLLMFPGYPSYKMELYQYVYENLLAKGGTVPIAAGWEDDYWYQAVTNQRLSEELQHWKNEKQYFKFLEKEGDMILVLYDNELYTKNQKYFDSLERVYENGMGFVAKLK